jgi:Oxidoreductase-like protein, N-terminal
VSTLSKPEEPTTCCGRGCQNCVWLQYLDELEEWQQSQQEADAKEVATSNEQKILDAIDDPSVRAFVQLEMKLKKKTSK